MTQCTSKTLDLQMLQCSTNTQMSSFVEKTLSVTMSRGSCSVLVVVIPLQFKKDMDRLYPAPSPTF